MSKVSNQVLQQHHVIPFALGGLEAISVKDSLFVSVRHLCHAFDLDFSSQRRKLVNDPKFYCGDMTTVAADGKQREMLTLPLWQVSGFLYSINANKVNPVTREALLSIRMNAPRR